MSGAKHVLARVLGLLAIVAGLAFGFQNCGSYQGGQTDYFASLASCSSTNPACASCAANDVSCIATANSEAVLMSVETPNPVQILQTDTAVDISGYCDPGVYSYNIIQYWLQDSAGNNLTQGYVPSGVSCDGMGRFEFTLPLSNTGAGARSLTLNVQLTAYPDASLNAGQAVTNPTGQGKSQLTIQLE
jgi:hypothetical protein